MQRRALLFDHLISAGEQVPVLGSHSSDRSRVRWLAPPAEMIDPCLIQGPCHLGPWRSRIFLISPPLISLLSRATPGQCDRSLRNLILYPFPQFRNGSKAPAIATRYARRSTLFWIFPDIAPSFSKRTPPASPPAKLPTDQTSHKARMRFPWK